MKPQDPRTIQLNVDWRVLIIVLIGAALIIAVSGGALAQGDRQQTINDPGVEAAPPQPAEEAPAPAPPAGAEAGDLLQTINGEWIEPAALGSSERAPDAPAAAAGTLYYLTQANFNTDDALTACAAGYRMASFWEIVDPSNLTYAGDHPAAFNRADSGAGPPSGWNGWVRTGGVSSGTNTAGRGNCQSWSTVDSASYGTTVKLANAWEVPPGEVSHWDATSFSCGLVGPVWCIGE